MVIIAKPVLLKSKRYLDSFESLLVKKFSYTIYVLIGIGKETVKSRIVSAQKAMFAAFNNCKANSLPNDIVLDFFHEIVMACRGEEIFGFENLDNLEKLQWKYAKYAFKPKNSATTFMVYEETSYWSVHYYAK